MPSLEIVLVAWIALFSAESSAFVGPSSQVALKTSVLAMSIPDVSAVVGVSDALPALTFGSASLIAQTDAWVQPTALVLGPFLNFLSLAMVGQSFEKMQ